MTRIKILTTGQTGASRAASATSVTPAGNIGATNVQAALEELDAEKQPLDSDLTAIAALSTQSFGRSLLTQASASAARTTLGVDYTTIAADTALTSRFGAPAMEGVPIWLQGHSWVAGQALGTSWGSRIAARLNTGTVTNRGVGGDMSYDLITRMNNGSGSTAWTPNQRGVGIIECALNDVRRMGTDARAIATFKRQIGLAIELFRSGARTEQASATFSGPWTNTANAFIAASGGTLATTSTVGHYADITFTGTEVTIITARLREGGGGGTFTVKEGSTLLATFDCSAGTDGPGSGYPTAAVMDYVKITGLAAGSHTLRIQVSVAGSIYLDSWLTPATAPMPVLLVADPYLTNWNTNSPYNVGSNAAADSYATALTELAATFTDGRVSVVDLRAGWVAATMLGSDGVHPNDYGCSFVADKVCAALAALPFRNGQNLLSVE